VRPPVAEVTGWLPAADELRAFEGIRLGDEDAFRSIAVPLQPDLRRLAALYVAPSRIDEVVRRSWATALAGHEMFRWQTPLATWVAGFAVATGRAGLAAHPRSPVLRPPTSRPALVPGGPDDWSDLPWSARWVGVGERLSAALDALPVAEREVVHGSDEDRWPDRRVCEVFGITAATHAALLASAHGRLHDAVAAHVGAAPGPAAAHRDDRTHAIRRWLGARPAGGAPDAPLDPGTVEVFRRWAASRDRRWWRLVRRAGRVSRRSAAPAGRRDGPASANASDPPTPT
jgi:DNA-directed RNA polymerase specialized sigma24 family protein